jgi:glycosyltransferase involved in cell wall biosynthesis
MNVLHLFSNHKVTGPAELALETARAVARTGDAQVRFFSSDVRRTRYRDRWLQQLARQRGVEEPRALAGVRLQKHLGFAAFFDVRKLARGLEVEAPDLVHAHLPNDHLLATWARDRSSLRFPIVRTLYDGEPPKPTWRTRATLGRAAAVVCLSVEVARALRENADAHRLDPARVLFLEPPIDAERFDPARPRGDLTRERKRARLGIPADAFCLGIVARMQTHRRFEVLLEAVRRARKTLPELRLLIVGRGTKQETVARAPVRDLGLEPAVVFTGYQAGEDYVATLAAMDAKVFLVPGSDGTCRAVREALAMGVPVIAARRGILPELVRAGETGLLVQDEPEELAQAILELARDPGCLRRLSENARSDAVLRFSFETFARGLLALYREVLAVT